MRKLMLPSKFLAPKPGLIAVPSLRKAAGSGRTTPSVLLTHSSPAGPQPTWTPLTVLSPLEPSTWLEGRSLPPWATAHPAHGPCLLAHRAPPTGAGVNESLRSLRPRGAQPCGLPGPYWQNCPGPHLKYTHTYDSWWAKRKGLQKSLTML